MMATTGVFTPLMKGGAFISKRIAVKTDVEPEDWQDVFDAVEAGSRRFSIALFHLAVGLGTMAGLFLAVAASMTVLCSLFPYAAPTYLAIFTLPLGFLVGAASGQKVGNAYLRVRFRLDAATRRGFATRLTLARTPGHWPLVVKKWLFTGDWTKSPVYDPRLPYVRIFVSGPAPATCAREDELWREIHGRISGDSLWEAGANHREISYPAHLPTWSRKILSGDGVEQLDQRLGHDISREWVRHLWRRACRQWPLLGSGDYPENARRESFEAHHLDLQGGREALLVVLRPSCFAAEVRVGEVDGEVMAA